MEVVSPRRELTGRLEAFIAGFEAAGRTPDRWQADWLMKALAALETGDVAAGEQAMQRAEVSEGVRPLQEAAEIPTDYEPPAIDEHRASFERIKAQQPD